MAQEKTLIEKLRDTRAGYAEELEWHRFLIDAYTGKGGFAGRISAPETSFLGWAAEVYGNDALSFYGRVEAAGGSYLDRHPREDQPKFNRRCDVAHYSNYPEAILDTLTSYVTKRPMTRNGEPKKVGVWRSNADGGGTSWESMLHNVMVPRAALLGWCPMMFDAPALPETVAGKVLTRADTNALGIVPKAIPLFPGHLLDFGVDGSGKLEWAKVKIIDERRAGALEPLQRVERYYIWTRATLEVYEITKPDGGQEIASGPVTTLHDFGEVPIVGWRYKPNAEHPVLGSGMIDSAAVKCRRLFNLESELDEHLSAAVFAMLQVPGAPNQERPGELNVGSGNGMFLPYGVSHEFKWLGPPSDIAGTFEIRIEKTITEIYRLARQEYETGGGVAESGVARAYKFEPTNRKLSDFALHLAQAEKQSLALVGRALGLAAGELEQLTVVPPSDFRTEDLAADLDNAINAVKLSLPATAEMELKKRVVAKMLPNMPTEMQTVIDAEFEEMRIETERQRAEQDEIDQATKDQAAIDAAAAA